MSAGAFIPVLHGAALDRPDEADTLIAVEAITAALVRAGFASRAVHIGLDLSMLAKLKNRNPLCVFNMVEALEGKSELAVLVPAVFDHYGMSYTGAGTDAWQRTASKSIIKDLLAAHGLPTPETLAPDSSFKPHDLVIVKSLGEHASIGIDAGSVVPAARAVSEIASRERQFGGRFFAERYIAGREFNISLLEGERGPIVLPPAEIDFIGFEDGRPKIVDYDAKWTEGSHGFHNTPRRFDFSESDALLLKRLTELCREVWRCFNLKGYARVDFRVDEEGRPWILEVNVNPCLAPDAGFVAAAQMGGLDFDQLVMHVVSASRGFARLAS